MRENLKFLSGNSIWRGLLLALLLTHIVSENLAEPKSIYKIEEVNSNTGDGAAFRKIETCFYALKNPGQATILSKTYQSQFERLRFLSKTLHLHTQLAISNAPNLLIVLMRASGYHLKSRSQSSEEPIPFHS